MDKDEIVVAAARYYVESKSTMRETAAKFGYSKSWVAKVFRLKLKYLSPELYKKVKEVSEENISVRHIRGAEAAKRRSKNKQILCLEN